MNHEKTNYIDLALAYIQEKSKQYKAGGYKKVVPLGRNLTDYQFHLFAFLMDMNFALLPVFIWVMEFFLILSGLISPKMFDLLFYVMYALLFVVSCIALPIFTSITRGQSFGYLYFGLKIVDEKNHEVNGLNLILRQVIGIGLPLMVLGYFYKVAGILCWWIFSGIVILINPRQQSLMDIILKLHTVHEPSYDIQFFPDEVEETEEKNDEPMTMVEKGIMPIDLHIRSNYSDDGYYDVEEIFKQAKELHLDTISITDHNCARQNAAAERFAELYGLQYIPGVEVDAQWNDMRVRVLGYYIDWANPIFETIERDSLKREKDSSLLRVKKFEEYTGVAIDVESLISNSRFQTITASDITSMVFNNERVRALPFVKKYLDAASSEQEAMRAFKYHTFGKGGPCYVKGDYPQLDNVIKAIHQAGGIAVLAGWHMDYFEEDAIEEMVRYKMDGIEVFSPMVNEETMTKLLRIAKRNKMFISCGSDYHGPTKKNRFLGVTKCPEKAIPLIRILAKPVNKAS